MNIEQTIYNTAIEEKIPSHIAVMMVQQAKVESANFSSNLFTQSNNLYGMKMPSKRQSPYIAGTSPVNPPAIEGKGGYAHYRSVEDSVRDLVHYFNYRKPDWSKITNEKEYASYLKSRGFYGPDQEVYANAMIRYFNDAKTAIGKAINQNQGISIATGLTILTMFTYFVIKVVKKK